MTLAAKRDAADALILRALTARSPANPSASLDAGLAPPLADTLAEARAETKLGRPLTLNQTAELIGCSPWTVRQTLIPRGLPFFRSAASGKLIFYEAQVVGWINRKQKLTGGTSQ